MCATGNVLDSYVCVLPSVTAGVRAVPPPEQDAWDVERTGWLQELGLSGAGAEGWRAGEDGTVVGEGSWGCRVGTGWTSTWEVL